MEGFKVEPSGDHRQLAAIARQMHVALTDQGFTEDQALVLTAGWWTALTFTSGMGQK